MSTEFIGRHQELRLLSDLQKKRSASLVVVYGRRRIGKSRLIEEFGADKKFYAFSGTYPEKDSTLQDQLSIFYYRFLNQFRVNIKPFQDWSEAFSQLAKKTQKGKTVILLDEISWMGSHDKNFLGKLKNAWDMEFKKNNQLILVLCGSVSSWIEKNLLAHKGFFGRISLKLRLLELSLPECNAFWSHRGATISDYEKLKILSVTGGIPKYLEEIKVNQTADEQIKTLCFTPSGLLFNDYDYIFSSMLERNSNIYHRIIETLCNKNKRRIELLENLDKKSGGTINTYLDELETAGFISKDSSWNLKSGSLSKLSRYRISDNYIRFYVKYILPSISRIKTNSFEMTSLSSLPAWTSIMGIQIENLVLNNRKNIQKLLSIQPSDIIWDGPYFQRGTAKTKGCQIDYLIQTRLGVLYLCEIKFTRNMIRKDIFQEVEEKMKNLSTPKNMSIMPVLLHIGSVDDEVLDSLFFHSTIDIKRLLY